MARTIVPAKSCDFDPVFGFGVSPEGAADSTVKSRFVGQSPGRYR
jgi:hypothetical protein